MVRRIFAIIMTVALCSLPLACSKPMELAASNKLPSTQAQVETSLTSNGNATLHVVVKHMPPPEKLAPGATTYVVWVQALTSDAKPLNLGAVTPDGDQEAKFEGSTALKSFDLFITAEPSATAVSPTGEKMLWGRVEQVK